MQFCLKFSNEMCVVECVALYTVGALTIKDNDNE